MTLSVVMTADPRYICGSWASCKLSYFKTLSDVRATDLQIVLEPWHV